MSSRHICKDLHVRTASNKMRMLAAQDTSCTGADYAWDSQGARRQMLAAQDGPSRSTHVHLGDGEELTAAAAMACALPPLELACAMAFATALLFVFRQFSMAWLLAAA